MPCSGRRLNEGCADRRGEPLPQIDREALAACIAALRPGEELPLLVTGNSMVPFLLNRRSTVFLVREPDYVPRVGDIILCRRIDGAYILHRIHKIRKDGVLILNGDAQRWTELILPQQVCCRVAHFVRTKRDIRTDSRSYRFCRWLWRGLRPLHAVAASGYYYWHRIPYKLGQERPAKKSKAHGFRAPFCRFRAEGAS